MPEENVTKPHSLFRILWVGPDNDIFNEVLTIFEEKNSSPQIVRSLDLKDLDLRRFQIIVYDLGMSDLPIIQEFQKRVQELNPRPTVLIASTHWDVETLIDLKNTHDIFGVPGTAEQMFSDIQTAIFDFKNRLQRFGDLKKVRTQNSRLELLTKNLEKIVLDRTQQDSDSNSRAQANVKNIQEILRFIKQVARAESIEDVLLVVRNELKKIHGLMPPVLIFPEGEGALKIFYFQGKQFVEKIMAVNSREGLAQVSDPRKMQILMSELFGRPFGQVESSFFSIGSKNRFSSQGILIFEHSLGQGPLEAFRLFSEQRMPLLQLAIENLLLRNRSQRMARQWANTFNKIQDPIFIIDASFEISLANSQLGEVKTGVCFRDFAGRDTPCVGCPVGQAMSSAQPQHADIFCFGKTYEVHSFPIFLEDQEFVSHVINQYVEITDSRALQGRVIQGEKMAAVGMLAGNVAHELNNPLTGIYALSDLLLSDIEEGSNTHKDLIEVRDAAKRCQTIIKDLLEFSDVDMRKTQNVDLNTIIAKTLPLLKMALRNHNSDINLSDYPLPADIQPQLFQQVVFNIVNNGCQAMSDGGTLSIYTEKRAGVAWIRIRDTGSGIPENLRDAIFDPFFTTKEVGKGTGLGLSMSRSVIEGFQGTLNLNTDWVDGSEFVISIPITPDSEST